jgi:hypothetical protein
MLADVRNAVVSQLHSIQTHVSEHGRKSAYLGAGLGTGLGTAVLTEPSERRCPLSARHTLLSVAGRTLCGGRFGLPSADLTWMGPSFALAKGAIAPF